jgi:hypothetical protein
LLSCVTGSVSGRDKRFSSSAFSGPAMRSTHLSSQWVQGIFPRWKSSRGINLETRHHLGPKLRFSGAWRTQGQLYILTDQGILHNVFWHFVRLFTQNPTTVEVWACGMWHRVKSQIVSSILLQLDALRDRQPFPTRCDIITQIPGISVYAGMRTRMAQL